MPETYYKKRILSFKFALEGIATAIKEEPNMVIHTFIGFLVILAGIYFKISKIDWIIIIFVIGLVISLELTNTAIETVVDSFIEKEHPGAKKAKDVSAAAVLVVSIAAFLIGVIIFAPYLPF